MDEDIYLCYLHVEVVAVLDGEVPHPAGGVRGRVSSEDPNESAVGRAQLVPRGERVGVCPAAGGLVPEPVVGGGLDDRDLAARGLDYQVVQVRVVVEEDGGDRLGLGFAGLGVGGEDLVAGRELADGDCCAGGEQDLRADGEAVAVGCDGISVRVGCAVFCGKASFEYLTQRNAVTEHPNDALFVHIKLLESRACRRGDTDHDPIAFPLKYHIAADRAREAETGSPFLKITQASTTYH